MPPSAPDAPGGAAPDDGDDGDDGGRAGTGGDPDLSEIGHYVATAHPPGSVFASFKCNFLSADSIDVVIAKSNRLEIRRFRGPGGVAGAGAMTTNDADGGGGDDLLPLALTLPINGRVLSAAPVRFKDAGRDCLFFTTEKGGFALISYDATLAHGASAPSASAPSSASPGTVPDVSGFLAAHAATGEHYPVRTHASGSFKSYSEHVLAGGRQCECGPLMAVDPLFRCVALHVYDGYLTILPVNRGYDPGRARRVPWRRNASAPGAPGGAGGAAGNSLAGGSGKPAAKPTKQRGLSAGPFGDAFHLRVEERTVLSMSFLRTNSSRSSPYIPQLALLHQDARGFQHVVSHGINVTKKSLVLNGKLPQANNLRRKGKNANEPAKKPAAPVMPPPGEQLKTSRVEGGSGCLIAVPPPLANKDGRGSSAAGMASMDSSLGTGETGDGEPSKPMSSAKALGGVVILGQRQITYHSTSEGVTRIRPTGGALLLSHCRVVESDPNLFSKSMNDSGSYGNYGNEDERNAVVRYLIGDDRGRIHLLSLLRKDGLVTTLHFDTLGTAATSSSLVYLGKGMVFVGSQWGNSQLIRILDEPVPVGTVSGGLLDTEGAKDSPLGDTTYVEIVEEYANLGPIVDFDLRACSDEQTASKVEGGKYRQSLVVTCSGVSTDGTVRVVRNGVGMREHAAVEMEGIKGMWSLRRKFGDEDDAFLVQSFVRETRVLGVQSAKDVEMEDDEESKEGREVDEDEEGGALAEVTIPGFDSSKSTLYAGNMLVGGGPDLLVQVVEDGVRLVYCDSLAPVAVWSPFAFADEDSEDDEPMGFITVASGNESGQIVVALRGGALVYLLVERGEGSSPPAIRRVKRVTLDREISCIDLNPFGPSSGGDDAMDVDGAGPSVRKSQLVAVGLWDDFSVRLLNLGDNPSSVLDQVLRINLGRGSGDEDTSQLAAGSADEQLGEGGQHMMARSLCLVTMDSQLTNSNSIINNNASSSATGNNLDMLLVGLGDGKLISFVVKQPGPSSGWSIHSRKEVSLGTQGVHLIPFRHGPSKSSGSCVLATGDRPTVVYLTGGNAGSNSNPKLNYSTISLTVEDDDDDEEEEEGGRHHASHKNISVNVASPFRSSLLFSSSAAGAHAGSSSLCVADDNTLRLGVIDDIQKLHVTSFRLGMTPRRICHHQAGRVYCVGCIGGVDVGMETNQNNCVRFFDDSTFEELNRINLEPFEMILSIESVLLSINAPPTQSKSNSHDNMASPVEYKPFIVMGTAYAYPDEDEPSQGRVIVVECNSGASGNLKSDTGDKILRHVQQVADLPLMGGIYSIAPFYGGNILVTCGSKTVLCQLFASIVTPGELLLNYVGSGHHGHLISLYVKSLVSSDSSLSKCHEKKQLAIVGDLMRSIALVEYYPKHQMIDELARDFNSNFCTEIAMLTNNIYLGSEGYNNLFVLQYSPNATTEQARVRLDTVGHYHLGEMVNKMMGGSLIMPSNYPMGAVGAAANGKVASDKTSYESNRKINVTIGSQTLYGTVDGTIGSILGLGGKTFAFLNSLQKAMDAIVRPVGDLSRAHYRAWEQEQKKHASCGFIDGDWIETFLDLNRPTMERVVKEMNLDTRWRIRDEGKGFSVSRDDGRQNLMDTEDSGAGGSDPRTSSHASVLTVEDVLGAVEEISMMH